MPLTLRSAEEGIRDVLVEQSRLIATLVRTDGEPTVEPAGGKRPPGSVLNVAKDVEVLVGLRGLVDPEREAERIKRTLKKLEKDLSGLDKRLNNPKFIEKAPAEVVAEVKEQREALERKKNRLREALELVAELKAGSAE